jgi:hypothetical protein
MLGISGQGKTIAARNTQESVRKLPKVKSTITAPVKARKKTAADKKPAETSSCGAVAVDILARHQTITELALERLSLPANAVGETGHAKVKFSHYNKSFPVHNGIIKWADIDEEYCISFAYRGNYGRILHPLATVEGEHSESIIGDESGSYFLHAMNKGEYRLEVVEDPAAGIGAEGLRTNTGPLLATTLATVQQPIRSTTRAMDSLTAELKSIAVTELGGAHAKDLLERRDLEDILFSGSS